MTNSTLFSNHGHVLLVLADDPEARLRDVASRIGITERAVQKIVRDLQHDGLVSVSKHGRRNRYRINTRKALRHPLEANRTVGALIAMMRDGRDAKAAGEEAPREHLPSRRKAPAGQVPEGAPALPAEPPERISAPVTEAPAEAGSAVAEAEEPARAPAKPASKKGRKPPGPEDQQGSLF